MKKIGVYGGTFDPPHHGHISLAIEMMEAHHLDQVLVCPAQSNPFKEGDPLTAAPHREEMVKRAIRGIQGLSLCRVELERPGPSYTVETLSILNQYFITKESSFKLYLIIGDDNAEAFFNWHQPLEILKLSTVVVGRRLEKIPEWTSLLHPGISGELIKGMTPTRYLEISSTEVRSRIQQGRRVEHLLPLAVWRYIRMHSLYRTN